MSTTTLRALSIVALGASLAATGCTKKPSARRATATPATAPSSYGLPWAIGPVPEGAPAASTPAAASAATGAATAAKPYTAAATPNPYGPSSAPPPAAISNAECREGAESLDGCRAALRAYAQAGQGEQALAAYERLCGLKDKLQGCGAFKSKAVGPGDRGTMASLAMCEAEAWEHCEDATTKVAALVAWRTTLKAAGCKAGASALCANYKQCKGRAQWGCKPSAAGEVCGCVPRCEGTVLAKVAGARTWPDGSKRGLFECAAR